VRGSCRAAFDGLGSCIDVRTGDLSHIDIDVKPRGGLCAATQDKCCECFKLKTEGSLMAIGGVKTSSTDRLRSAEVLNTSCDFPLPEADGRNGHISVTTADDKTLVCGGRTPSDYTASCLQFNFKTRTWEHHSNMRNKYRTFGSAIALKQGVYIIGGWGGFERNSSEFLPTGSSVWTQGPDVPGGGVRMSCAVKLSDTEFVILGGYDQTQALHYSETKKMWTEWPRLTHEVYGHSCVRLGDKILVAGGQDSKGRTVIYDTKTGSARDVASLKHSRYRPAMVVYGGKAIILGGYGSGKRRSDGEVWNMDTETWDETDISLNNGRSQFSLVVMAEKIDCKPRYQLKGPLIAIGGSLGTLRSAEVLNTSCDFPLPEGRRDHISVTTPDGKTLVCGGKTPSGYTPSCLQFDYKSKSWKEHSQLLSKYRHYSAVVILPRGVYVLGGKDDAKSSSEFLATGSSVWTQGPDIPGKGVYFSCAVKLSDTEFVILGSRYDKTLALVYSETKKAWTHWPKLTQGVYGPSCMRLGDNILMAGGFTTQRTVIIDTKTGSAREVASLKYARGAAEMELYGGNAVILGGFDGTGTRRNDGEMWNMDKETWQEANISLKNGRSSYSLVAMAEEIEC